MERSRDVKSFLSADMKLVLVIFLVFAIGFLSLYMFNEINYQFATMIKLRHLMSALQVLIFYSSRQLN